MKANNNSNLRTCPLCGAQYGGVPALSRKYPSTSICPDCGTREALESIVCMMTEEYFLSDAYNLIDKVA